MYCLKCGYGISDEAIHCPKCGAKQQPITEPTTPVARPSSTQSLQRSGPSPSHHALACPHCVQTDRVQKVTSIIDQNTVDSVVHSVGSGSATTVGYGGGKVFVGQTYGEAVRRRMGEVSPASLSDFHLQRNQSIKVLGTGVR